MFVCDFDIRARKVGDFDTELVEEFFEAFAVNAGIKKVTEDFDRFSFNTAISSIMETVNALYQYKDAVDFANYNKALLGEALRAIVVMLSPIVPHITQELWTMMGKTESLFSTQWPKHDENALVVSEVEVVVQINGKIRDKMMISAELDPKGMQEAALSSDKIKAMIDGKQVAKVIAVPKKLINIVVK